MKVWFCNGTSAPGSAVENVLKLDPELGYSIRDGSQLIEYEYRKCVQGRAQNAPAQ